MLDLLIDLLELGSLWRLLLPPLVLGVACFVFWGQSAAQYGALAGLPLGLVWALRSRSSSS